MNLKPIYNTGTITFIDSPEKITLKKIDSSFVKDPEGIIPNGIYKVFKSEKNKQKSLVVLNLVVFALAFMFLMLFAFAWNTHWFWYIPMSLIAILALVKLTFVLLESKHLKTSIEMYRDSLIAGSRLTPPFISNIYIQLFKKQARQNWLIIFFLFYGTIATLLFWWLKDINWWIFKFKDWILNLTKNPELVGAFMIGILVTALVLYIYFTIYRKKRIIDIQSFFGNEVISQVEIDQIVKEKNKFYRRIFFISILVVLIFPFIGWIIYKKFIKK